MRLHASSAYPPIPNRMFVLHASMFQLLVSFDHEDQRQICGMLPLAWETPGCLAIPGAWRDCVSRTTGDSGRVGESDLG